MQERKQGCICELDGKTGEPVYPDYPECPVHKSDAPTPRNTALEILSKYRGFAPNKLAAYQCAEICIDQIIDVIKTFGGHSYAIVLLPHYEQAKKEIRSL